ncbi:MAG TPA: DUF192 domain-containing protein [Symbiobacteriaceae bacterium]|jgi:hypothetical protein
MIVRNASRDLILGTCVANAGTFSQRLRGLMFRKELAPGEGLVIRPCNSVHSHFMRFPIDVLFLDRGGRVVHVMPAMRPWKQSPFVRGAVAVLELAAGAAGATAPGDLLVMEQ